MNPSLGNLAKGLEDILLFQENFYRKINSTLVISEIQIQNVATKIDSYFNQSQDSCTIIC